LIYFFLAFLFCGGQSALAIDFNSLASDPLWIGQLQYRKTILNHWKGEADGPGFFISSQGKSSPAAELEATYKIFQEHPDQPWGYTGQPVICAFPTRKYFLEQKLGIQFRDIPCKEREEWKRPLSGTKFYLVYSSAFPNNPASMFGHTFVLLSKHDPPDSAQGLFDYAINFSADTAGSDEKSLLYTIKGTLGGYPARYRLYPFYQMINLYINWESRDLWYLKIPWDEQQIDRFLDHVWEIFTTTHFDYYFFDENCSYRLLAAMDYVDPNLHAVDHFYSRFPLYYVSPLSTYKYLHHFYKDNTPEYFTPSLRKTLKNEISHLNTDEKKHFHHLRRDSQDVEHENNVKVLDTLITLLDYKKRTASSNYLSSQVLDDLDKTLRRRSQIRSPSVDGPAVKAPASPLISHEAHSIYFGLGQEGDRKGSLAGGKVAYHDILSPTEGFERWSHLNFLEADLTYFQNKFKVRSFIPLNIISFFPIESYESKLSWRAELGYNQQLSTYLRGGVGASVQDSSEKAMAYGFISPILSTAEDFTNGHGYLLEAELGFLAEATKWGKIWIFYRDFLRPNTWNFDDNLETTTFRTAFYLDTNNEIRLETDLNDRATDSKIYFQHNF